MLANSAYRVKWRCASSAGPLASFLSGSLPTFTGERDGEARRSFTSATLPSPTLIMAAPTSAASSAITLAPCATHQNRNIFSSSSFSALPEDEERKEKERVDALSPYQREIELRQLDSELARLQTLRAINTGELYTIRGKFKMLSRDYGMGFLAWYWTVWFATAGLSYAAIEVGGVDPLMVAAKVETWLNFEPHSISGRIDPTLGQIGLVVAANECLEPLRLPFVVMTTKPVVNFFSSR